MNIFAKHPYLIPLIFCTVLLFQYPFIWNQSLHWYEFQLFTPAVQTLLAILLLTLDRERLYRFFVPGDKVTHRMLCALIPAGVVLLLHYYWSRGNHELFLSGLAYFVIPILGALYYREFSRKLLWLTAGLGTLNFCFLLSAALDHDIPAGLTGNWNWSASLMFCGAIALSTLSGKKWYAASVFILSAALCFLWFFDSEHLSRGAVVALLGSFSSTVFFLFRRRNRFLAYAAVIAAVCGLLCVSIGKEQSDQVRLHLFRSAIEMIKENPLTGCGNGRFESEVSSRLPEAYYLLDVAADRNPHPHNELLYLGSTLGIGGIIMLAAYALIGGAALGKCRRKDREIIGIAMIFFLLFIHGQLDVILTTWPCSTVFLLCIGILWGFAADNGAAPLPVPEMEKSDSLWPLHAVQLLLFAGLCIFTIRCGVSSYYSREAQIDMANRNQLWKKSIDWHATPFNLYAGAQYSLFAAKDPETALQRLKRIPETGIRRYVHSMHLAGRALAVQGKYKEAIACLEEEQRNYPLSISNQAVYIQVLQLAGEKEKLPKAQAGLNEILTKRKVSPDKVPDYIHHWGRM